MHSPFYTPLPRVQNPGAMFSKVLASVAISGRDAEGVFHDELDDSACRAAEPKVNVGLASRLVVGHEVLVPQRRQIEFNPLRFSVQLHSAGESGRGLAQFIGQIEAVIHRYVVEERRAQAFEELDR